MSGRTGDGSSRWLDALNKVRKIGTTLLDQQLWCWGRTFAGQREMLCSPTVLPNIDHWKASTEVPLTSGVALAEVELFYWDSGFSMAMGTEDGFSCSGKNARPNRQQRSIFRCPYGNRSNSLSLRRHVMWKRGDTFSACSLKASHGWATTSGGFFLNTGLTIANGVLTQGRRNVSLHTRWLQSGMNSSNTYFYSLEAIDKHQAQIIIVLNNRPTMYVVGLPNHHVKPKTRFSSGAVF